MYPSHIVMLVTNDVVRDARVRKEATSAARAGYKVTILGIKTDETPAEEEWCVGPTATVTIRRVAHPMRGTGNAVTRRIGNLQDLQRMRRDLAHAAIAQHPDLVHANDFDTLPAGVAVKNAIGCPLVYDSHELYVELFEPHSSGIFERLLLAAQKYALRRHEARIICSADAVTTVNPLIAGELARRYGIPEPSVVMNAPVTTAVAPLGLPDLPRPIFIYQGGFTRGRGLCELAEVFPQTSTGSLVLMGWGPLCAELEDLAARPEAQGRIVLLPPVPQEEVVDAAASADVGLIPYRPVGLNNYYASPNKLFDYLHAGIAIIASDLPFVRSVIEDTGAGLLVDSEDVEQLIAAADDLARDPKRLSAYRTAARESANRYSWEAQEAILLGCYARLLVGRGPAGPSDQGAG